MRGVKPKSASPSKPSERIITVSGRTRREALEALEAAFDEADARDLTSSANVPRPAPRAQGKRGVTFGTEAQLRAAVQAYAGLGVGWGDPAHRAERGAKLESPAQRKALVHLEELRKLSAQLAAARRRASLFVESTGETGGAVDVLKAWIESFWVGGIPATGDHGTLARIVAWNDGLAEDDLAPRLSDADLALVALRLDYWPETKTPLEKLTVLAVVQLVTKAVRSLRTGN
jgi:hypothetical protein